MGLWLVLLISCAFVQGRKHVDPLDLLDLDELLELKRAYVKELEVGLGESDELESDDNDSQLFDSNSSEYDLSEDSENSSDLFESDDEDDEEAVGIQDKDGWVIYPEWSQWDPLGESHSVQPVNEDKPVGGSRPRRARYRSRHRRPRRRGRYRRRRYRRRRPRRSYRSRSRRHSRRDDYEEVQVGKSEFVDHLFDSSSDELALGAEMPDYLFDLEEQDALSAEMPDYLDLDDFEDPVGDSFELPDSNDLFDSEEFAFDDEVALGDTFLDDDYPLDDTFQLFESSDSEETSRSALRRLLDSEDL